MSILTTLINKIKGYNNKIKESLSVYEAQLYLIEQIDSSKFSGIYGPKYSMVNIRSIYPDVYQYTKLLKAFINKTPINEYIPAYEVASKTQIISIKLWFMVNDTYLDPISSIEEFLYAAKEFIELYKHYSEDPEAGFNSKKNLSNTKVIINDLFNLLEDLKNV